jgi:hypothetical protein
MLYSRLVPLYCNFRDNLQYSIYATRGGCTTKYCISQVDRDIPLMCHGGKRWHFGVVLSRFLHRTAPVEIPVWGLCVRPKVWKETGALWWRWCPDSGYKPSWRWEKERERERLIREPIPYHSDIFSTQYFTIATIIGRKEMCSKTALHQIEKAFCRILLLWHYSIMIMKPSFCFP